MKDIKAHDIGNHIEATVEKKAVKVVAKKDKGDEPASLYKENVFVDFPTVNLPNLIEHFLSFSSRNLKDL